MEEKNVTVCMHGSVQFSYVLSTMHSYFMYIRGLQLQRMITDKFLIVCLHASLAQCSLQYASLKSM